MHFEPLEPLKSLTRAFRASCYATRLPWVLVNIKIGLSEQAVIAHSNPGEVSLKIDISDPDQSDSTFHRVRACFSNVPSESVVDQSLQTTKQQQQQQQQQQHM